jgi:Ca-activated chloride channel homolog
MSEFHFLRPEFLLLIPLVLLMAILIAELRTSSNWSAHIAASKLKLLTRGEGSSHWRNPLFFALGGLVCCLALAGPSWEMRPVPTTENSSALVILLDLSPSMLAQDIQPDRLVRARLKITDLLRLREDGQTALVAYSGSAHRVSPLTDDASTIEALLPALHPAVMPQTGSNIEAALELGLELLASTGYQNQGHMLVVTDGIEPDAQKAINDMLPAGVKLSVLGVGSIEGAPIPLGGGNFYRDSRGDIVLARLNRNELQILAGRSGGRYIELQPDDSDLNYLLDHIESPSAESDTEIEIETTYDSWHDAGYWLIILLIPLALFAFRRDFLICLPLLIIFALPSPKAEAGAWQDLWLTKDQQAQKALEQGDSASAAELFESSDWKAYAAYQAQEFEAAVDNLGLSENPSLYNLGTSLARSGQLQEALENLNSFVQQNPEHENARYNRDLVEQLLQQQEQQQEQQQNQQSSDQNQEGESEQGEEGDGQESSQQAQNSETGEEQESEQQNQESQQQSADTEEETEQEQAQAEPESDQQEGEETEELAAMPELSPEDLSDASEQWLRAIPDDPSGLLRRKFEYESQLYQQQRRFLPPTSANEEQRY